MHVAGLNSRNTEIYIRRAIRGVRGGVGTLRGRNPEWKLKSASRKPGTAPVTIDLSLPQGSCERSRLDVRTKETEPLALRPIRYIPAYAHSR
jgi:hypothetical protein